MKRILLSCLSVMMLALLTVPECHAIITDPDDYIWYDTGILGTSRFFDFPAWMEHGENVIFKKEIGGDLDNPEENVSNARDRDMLDKFAELTGDRTLREIVGLKRDDNSSLANGILIPAGDSLILNLPFCDSLYVESWHERGLAVFNNRHDTTWYMGYSSNYAAIIGIRYYMEDSIRIVLKGSGTDWMVPQGSNGSKNMELANNYTHRQRSANPSNRAAYINRIKVFSKIDKGTIPPFEGTHSGWTGQYRPGPSGTVDLNAPITDNWSGATFAKYASDLGVVRSILTASKSMQVGYDDDLHRSGMRITALGVTPDTTDFTNGAHHLSYFDIAANTVKFQDLVLKFDFAIRHGADSCVVAAQVAGDTAWTVLGSFANSANPVTQMASVACPLPEKFNNQKKMNIRILMNKGSYPEGGELVLSSLKLDGWDDYRATSEDAKKIAYITSAVDRLHILNRSNTEDASDMILRHWLNNPDYKITVFHKELWNDLDTEAKVEEAFKDYDLVVLSRYLSGDEPVVRNLKTLVGKKPFLNFNVEAYKNWNAALSVSADSPESLVTGNNYFYHPVFAGMGLVNEGDMIALPALSDTLPALEAAAYQSAPEGYLLGAATSSSPLTIYEQNANKVAKYMLVALSKTGYPALNDMGYKLIDNAMVYLLSPDLFVAPNFNMVPTGAIVENSSELAAALSYDYASLNLAEILIQMKPSKDADGLYRLAGDDIHIGGGKMVLKPYEAGMTVSLAGAIKTANDLNLTSMTFRDLHVTAAEVDQPFFSLKGRDIVSDGIYFENCDIENVNSLFQATLSDSLVAGGLTVRNSRLNHVGQSGKSFIALDNSDVWMDKVVFEENVVRDYQGGRFIDWQTPAYHSLTDYTGSKEVISINHNSFVNETPATGDILRYAADGAEDALTVAIKNNIFYQTFSQGKVQLTSEMAAAQPRNTLQVKNNLLVSAAAQVETTTPGQWTIDQKAALTMDSLNITEVFEDNTLSSVAKISPLYYSGEGRTYLGAKVLYSDRVQPLVLPVHNADELRTALEISIAGDVIELYDNEAGTYLLGQRGFDYPKTGGTLVIRAAEGQQPVLFGSITPMNACRLDTLVFENLTWQGSPEFADYDKDVNSPFAFLNVADTIGLLHISHCTFKDLDNQMIIRTNNCAGLYLGEIRVDNSFFDNMGGTRPDGTVGAHFFQFSNKNDYTISRFIFVHNIVSNFHGSQMFNISRSGSAGDSVIVIDISHNLFYRVGGNAKDSNRNFLEFNSSPVGCDVSIYICNNIFYKRWSDVNKPVCNLALYNVEGVKSSKIEVLNNYYEGEYYPEYPSSANPMSPSVEEDAMEHNLEQTSGDVPVHRYGVLDWEAVELDEDVFEDEATFLISQESPLFTAGVDHTYLGPRYCYRLADAIRTMMAETASLVCWTEAGNLLVDVPQGGSVLRVYDMMGRTCLAKPVAEGRHQFSGLGKGLYLVRLGDKSAKVMIR
ncbi:MAG: hypothetical protein IJR64_08345 [Bacteroidales bacterium]|nr:hypothetical protein [Bacteroidales bacterium]